MTEKRQTYRVQVAGLQRDLRLFEVAPGVRIAVLNILGDTEFVQACAQALAGKLSLAAVRCHRHGRGQKHPARSCHLFGDE